MITGASSGFGRALAEAALARGHRVVGTARDPDTVPAGVQPVALELTDRASIDRAVSRAGRVDVLVNNAGYGLIGALEELSEDELRRAFEANLFGALRLTRAVLPQMRARRAGRIVQMSSVIGVTSGLGGAAYAGPKAALEAMSEALAAEVAHLGIRVTIVEPGAFRTDFSGRSLRLAAPLPDYEPVVGPPKRAFQTGHGKQPGDPRDGAEAILDAVERDDPPLRLPLGRDAHEWLGGYLRGRMDEVLRCRVTSPNGK
jgi:NAD(P)-dependent dehydrogenase (short-subunit alcohol dehydrogenase family)